MCPGAQFNCSVFAMSPFASPLNPDLVPGRHGGYTATGWADSTPFADNMSKSIIQQITDGRTDLVSDYLAAGHAATSTDKDETRLIKWCAYYGDVSAIRFLLANGETIQSLGDNLDLNTTAFHGHWRLCQFLIEQGADVNKPQPETGESPLHAALCTADRLTHDLVLKVLLGNGANPNCVTKPSA